ncbi:hypothetical protein [Cohnella silvisoli]|uniref:HIG1 domain-containing protein n=1 Tax=Cohnella silvisoli TaxID=2873699 RepID=A0ABV1L2P0_9BACL|nr:hypothetical protein [Cohnella silvisoli]MCD9025541.1 hypothetical protein [Cohnella silvisoli]
MNTNVLLIVTLIIMAAAVVITLKVGSTLSNKEGNSTYSANRGRKWGRLLSIYLVVIVAVLIIFIAIMNE